MVFSASKFCNKSYKFYCSMFWLSQLFHSSWKKRERKNTIHKIMGYILTLQQTLCKYCISILFVNSFILFPYPPMSSCDPFTLPVTSQFNITCSQVTHIIVQIVDTDRPANFHFIFLYFCKLQDSTRGDWLGVCRRRLFWSSERRFVFIWPWKKENIRKLRWSKFRWNLGSSWFSYLTQDHWGGGFFTFFHLPFTIMR